MPTLTLTTTVLAPPERCFDLARDIGLHARSLAGTGERAVAGVRHGLIGPGDRVTWEAVHLGWRWRMTVRVTEFDRPRRFVDEMERGPFAALRHEHLFSPIEGGTCVVDVFAYAAPFGPLGRLAERLVLDAHLRRLLAARNAFLRRAAEAGRPATGAPAGHFPEVRP